MPDNNTEIIESAEHNNGQRTVIRTVLNPYATVVPHFHNLFTETIEVVEGELDIWNGFGKVHLEKGQSVSIEKQTLHHYVAGKMKTIVQVSLEPGNEHFEHAIKIIQGLKQDNEFTQLLSTEYDKQMLLSIITDLTDSNVTGDNKEHIDALRNSPETFAIERLKQEWLQRYT